MKKVKFSDAENKTYLDTAYNVEWKALQDRAPDCGREAAQPDRQLGGGRHERRSHAAAWLQALERQLVRWENVFGALAIAILVGCGVLICVDVALRYVFNRPIVGGIEIIEYALVYITFLGASWAVPRGAHIDIDVCVQAMPKFWQRVCAFLSNLISLGVAVVLMVFGASVTWTAYMRGAFKPTTLEIPTWIVLLIIPIG